MDGGEEGRRWSAERGHVPASAVDDHRTDRCPDGTHPPCCPLYHEAIELIGRRWTGAIVSVLIHRPALRFGEIAESVPELSDRLLSERMKELEARGVVTRTVRPGRPVRVEYELTEMGRALEPAVQELERWARQWLGGR